MLGSYVIAEIIEETADQGEKVDVSSILKEALVGALVLALQKMTPDEMPQCNIRIGKKFIIIPPGQIHEVKCQILGCPGDAVSTYCGE